MIPKDLVVIGMPSSVGGGDVELYDQIKCWSKMGIKIHLIPTVEPRNCVDLNNLNVIVHSIKDYSVCDGQIVIGYCNMHFLKDISLISKLAKRTIWASCMCFNFKEEIEAAYYGLIDTYIYQSFHQYQKCGGHLLNASKRNNKNYKVSLMVPYFDRTPFHYKPNDVKPFKLGRISRADPAKFGKNQFKIYKKTDLYPILIVGWNERVADKFKNDIDWINKKVSSGDIKLVPEGEMNNVEFFDSINIMSMTTDTFENTPRVALEAVASGCALVVDSKPGWTTILSNDFVNVGTFASTIDDFSKYTKLVWNGYWNKKHFGQLNDPNKILDRFNFETSAKQWEKIFS